jgi:hypothetical protein
MKSWSMTGLCEINSWGMKNMSKISVKNMGSRQTQKGGGPREINVKRPLFFFCFESGFTKGG